MPSGTCFCVPAISAGLCNESLELGAGDGKVMPSFSGPSPVIGVGATQSVIRFFLSHAIIVA